MNRRDFLKSAFAGVAAAAVGYTGPKLLGEGHEWVPHPSLDKIRDMLRQQVHFASWNEPAMQNIPIRSGALERGTAMHRFLAEWHKERAEWMRELAPDYRDLELRALAPLEKA